MVTTEKYFEQAALICVDWGSSNFRALLLNFDGKLLDVINSTKGMLDLKPHEFEAKLMKLLAKWLTKKSLPIIMAGMVGSQKGWHEVDYLHCPINISELAGSLRFVKNKQELKIAIIAGIDCQSLYGQYDVTRGEEVQTFGALELIGELKNNTIFCLPGTHSKWMRVEDGKIVDFTTYMTGELFNIISAYSILSCDDCADEINEEAFLAGVKHVKKNGGIMHQIFAVRTHMLNGEIKPANTKSYLSGILISSEINEMLKLLPQNINIVLIGGKILTKYYAIAFDYFKIQYTVIDGEKAAYTSMYSIAKQANFFDQIISSGDNI